MDCLVMMDVMWVPPLRRLNATLEPVPSGNNGHLGQAVAHLADQAFDNDRESAEMDFQDLLDVKGYQTKSRHVLINQTVHAGGDGRLGHHAANRAMMERKHDHENVSMVYQVLLAVKD